MRTVLDFSPLYRSTVGFDRMARLLNDTARLEGANNWPPYNIEKTGEDAYRIVMAVAGFKPEELDITSQPGLLVVAGRKADANDNGSQYLHRGIAGRGFKQTFNLADFVKVTGASLENGLLTIELVREVPEAMKPRRISVQAGSSSAPNKEPKTIEHDKAA